MIYPCSIGGKIVKLPTIATVLLPQSFVIKVERLFKNDQSPVIMSTTFMNKLLLDITLQTHNVFTQKMELFLLNNVSNPINEFLNTNWTTQDFYL